MLPVKRVLLPDIIFSPSVQVTQCVQQSSVFEVSKIILSFFMMSEARWMAVENVVFYNKQSIVIKLPVKSFLKLSLTRITLKPL